MARHHIIELPKGYTIIRIEGRQYPMILQQSSAGAPIARAFLQQIDSTPISYSKRVYAIHFIEAYAGGRVPWVAVDGEEKKLPGEEARLEFLDSVADDEEYAAYLEHRATPRADEY